MASLITNFGLQVEADRLAGINGPPAAVLSMAVDDKATAFAAADTDLAGASAPSNPTNIYAFGFDATYPSRASQTVTYRGTIATGSGNFTIRRVSLHNIASGSVTATSDTLVAGVDGQALTKTSSFALTPQLKITHTSV